MIRDGNLGPDPSIGGLQTMTWGGQMVDPQNSPNLLVLKVKTMALRVQLSKVLEGALRPN